jgi:hypothetical protein
MKLFDCLHVIVTVGIFRMGDQGPLVTDQVEMVLAKPDWTSEFLFLKDLLAKSRKCIDVKVTPIVKYSCCLFSDNATLPDWYVKQDGKWSGEQILEIFKDEPL